MMNYFHSGDLGDVIYALPAIRALGKGNLYLNSRPWTAKMTPERANVLRPLLEAQDYIGKVIHGDAPKSEYVVNFSTFRNGGLIYGVSLMELQSDWVNANTESEPWLKVAPSAKSRGRIVCHRSPRYHNPYFRWDEIGEKFGTQLLFVGLPHEVEELRRVSKVHAEYAITNDYLELARLIAGADLFIGNQSSPMGLAIGLGVPFIQETCLWTPDCLYPRKNGFYCYDGGIPSLDIPEFIPPPDVDRNVLPPGGWQVISRRTGERVTFKSHRLATKHLKGYDRYLNDESAAQEVDRQNAVRVPHLVRRDSTFQIFGKVKPLVEAVSK
jgi:hypothetical protein